MDRESAGWSLAVGMEEETLDSTRHVRHSMTSERALTADSTLSLILMFAQSRA